MPDSLNARMAAALAPAVGEAAVYVESPGFLIGDRNHPSVHYASMVPVNFADPAVGWGVFERWCANITVCHDIWMRRHPDHCEAEITIYRHGPNEEHKGKDTSLWGAILAAWAQALGVSGDE